MEEKFRYFLIRDPKSDPVTIFNRGLIAKLNPNGLFYSVNVPANLFEGLKIYEDTKGIYCIESNWKGTEYFIKEIKKEEVDIFLEEQKKEFGEYKFSEIIRSKI